MSPVTKPVIDAIDRVNEIATCLEAVSNLTIPGDDFVINRDKLATLLGFLLDEQRLALDRLETAIRTSGGVNMRAVV